jgi:SAM-dependent methyltransferase
MSVFPAFPKSRPVLPAAYQQILQRHYLENREGLSRGSFLTRRVESWMHYQIAADSRGLQASAATLEIGAGTLNHLAYERTDAPYDVIEPNEALLNAVAGRRARVRAFYRDIAEIPAARTYRRIISIAVFEHLTDLPAVTARAGQLLTDDGSLRVAIPNEGHWAWKAGYRIANGIEFKLRYGLDYDLVMRHEHLNTASEIEAVLAHFFEKVSWRVLGVSRRFSFYRAYICSGPRRGRCTEFLHERTSQA